ncbi:MAG: TlpA family protein disulfide reductase [Polyangiaceae bacterium]|nr:TlpA family protein disulfide reductase [Polyangiaceae bacterium]
MNQTAVRVLQLAFVLAASATAYSFVASARDGEARRACTSMCALAPAYVGSNLSAPNLQLRDMDGREVQLSDFRGQTVVLVLWTTTCDSCKEQMPGLAQLGHILREDRRAVLLTVAVDESADEVRRVLMKHTGTERPFSVLLDPESTWVLGRYGTKKFPETWIIDSSGVIRARYDGARDWSSGLALDLLETVREGATCPVSVRDRAAMGPAADVCRAAAAL